MIFSRLGRKPAKLGAGMARMESLQDSFAVFQDRFQVLILVLSFLVLVAAITKPPEFRRKNIGYDITSQPVALEEVRAEIYFESEDLLATKAKQEEAAARVPDAYGVDAERVDEQLRMLEARIQNLVSLQGEAGASIRDALLNSHSDQPVLEVVSGAVTEYVTSLRQRPEFEGFPDAAALAAWFMPDMELLPTRVFEESAGHERVPEKPRRTIALSEENASITFPYASELARVSREALDYVLLSGVNGESLKSDPAKAGVLIMRQRVMGDLKVSEEVSGTRIPGIEAAQLALSQRIGDMAKSAAGREADRPVDWAKLRTSAYEMAKPFVAATLSYDQVYTEGTREQARTAVPPVMKEIQPGEVIQRHGERWTPQSRSDVLTYWSKLEADREPSFRLYTSLLAHAIIVMLVLVSLVRSISLLTPTLAETRTSLNVAFLILCGTAISGRLVWYFEPTGFLLPTAAGAILLAILINPRVAVITSFMTALLVSIQYGYDWRLLVVTCAMSIAGVFGMYRVRRRGDMTGAALKATAVGVLTMLAITLAMESLSGEAALRRIALVLLNGCACMFIVPGVLPPLERLFGITTDIQLLEYSDLNNEILGRMAIEMPATYAHSLMLGQLAEAAANAIGANGLLARVCAYYHDVGKLRRPEYFSENQVERNVHDELSPRMSARAIASHISYGAGLAREYHLPKPIIDAIYEHHGTQLISFFYQQAIEQNKHQDVREEDFRYPGPKPQSRETAILMICDAVESGVRSIKNLNEDRIREFVDKIIRTRSSDRQFDECDLTLRDLDVIKEVITRRMLTALHTRIAYPDRKTDRKGDNMVYLKGGTS